MPPARVSRAKLFAERSYAPSRTGDLTLTKDALLAKPFLALLCIAKSAKLQLRVIYQLSYRGTNLYKNNGL